MNSIVTIFASLGNDKIMELLDTHLTPEEKNIYFEHYAWHLNHNPEKDFVVDLDLYWEKMGYASKQKATDMIEKYFEIGKEYSNQKYEETGLTLKLSELLPRHGGRNIKKFYLTVNGFKQLCMLANTKEAKLIRLYYVKMENILHEYNKYQNQKMLQKENALGKEQALLELHDNKTVNYLIIIGEDVKIEGHELQPGEQLAKIGESHKLVKRVMKDHKREIGGNEDYGCTLTYVIDTTNSKQLEADFKKELSNRMITVRINGKLQTEILLFDKHFTLKDAVSIWERLNEKFITKERYTHDEKMMEFELKKFEIEQTTIQKEMEMKIRLAELDVEKVKIQMNQGRENEKTEEIDTNQEEIEVSNEIRLLQYKPFVPRKKKESSSKFFGVSKVSLNTFRVCLTYNKKEIAKGYSQNEKYAAFQYDLWLKRYLNGDYVNNIPQKDLIGFEEIKNLKET